MLALEIQGESFMFSGLNSGDLLKKYAWYRQTGLMQ
jgi:hypothetical protein